jgi:hypothetical protein
MNRNAVTGVADCDRDDRLRVRVNGFRGFVPVTPPPHEAEAFPAATAA